MAKFLGTYVGRQQCRHKWVINPKEALYMENYVMTIVGFAVIHCVMICNKSRKRINTLLRCVEACNGRHGDFFFNKVRSFHEDGVEDDRS